MIRLWTKSFNDDHFQAKKHEESKDEVIEHIVNDAAERVMQSESNFSWISKLYFYFPQ